MNGLMDKMQKKLIPLASKLDDNIYLSAIKNAFIKIMAILIVGSFFTLFANLPINGYAQFMASHLGKGWQKIFTIPNDVTMNLMTIFVIIGIAVEMAKSRKLDKFNCSVGALVSFFALTPLQIIDKNGDLAIPINNLGSSGLFLGMICAFASVAIFNFTEKHNWKIKMPDSVPPTISGSFNALIPVAIILILFNGIRIAFSVTNYQYAQTFIFNILQQPLTSLGATLPATLIAVLLEGILWSCGLNGGSIVGGIMQPIWLALTAQNATAFTAGKPLPNIINCQFYMNFVKPGGSGATLGLVIVMLFLAKSAQMKSVAKLAILPNIFSINEPVLFGIPIVLNPIMVIPFVLNPIILGILSYVVMKLGLVPLTNGVNIPWTTPPIIAGFLCSGVAGAIWNAIELVISAVVYLPFFKIADQLALEKEQKTKKA